ncbi:MAG: Na(+)/H(+) antiporter subunit D, partial [Desulfurivibrionaceae bacterium]
TIMTELLLPPALIYIVGALLVPLLPGRIKSIYLLILPVAAFLVLVNTPAAAVLRFDFLGFELVPFRIDRLSLVFAYIYLLISLIGTIYTLHFR